jgi:4-hydroxy-3-methylbut-2-enyl diphosphate reductase
LVVGSANSSNSVRLVEVALAAGAGAAYLIEDVSQIDPAWLERATTLGLTSGASVPEHLVSQVVAHLREHGVAEVVELEFANESLTFTLPLPVRGGAGDVSVRAERPGRRA